MICSANFASYSPVHKLTFFNAPCSSLVTSLIVDKSVKLDEKDVYGTVDQQLLFVKIYVKFWDLREEMLDNLKKQKNADQSDS